MNRFQVYLSELKSFRAILKFRRATFFRPAGAGSLFVSHPRLTPLRQAQGRLWTVFFRRFAAFNRVLRNVDLIKFCP